MKVTATLALAALAATLVAAQPHRKSNPMSRQLNTVLSDRLDHHNHRRFHEKRGDGDGGFIGKEKGNYDTVIVYTTEVITEDVWVTVTPTITVAASPQVNAPASYAPISIESTSSTTSTTNTSSSSTTSSTSSSTQSSLTSSSSTSSTLITSTSSTSSPPPPPSSSSTAAPTPSPVAASGFGLAWTPYLTGGCKSSSQAASEFAQMQGYSIVRIYGTDCNQVALAVQYASQYGMKIFASIFDLSQVESEAQAIISAVNGNWGIIDTISVGNEDVNNGVAISTVASAMAQAKSILSGAGFNGNLVHVDTQNAFESNPSMCNPSVAGSYIAANTHPFFNAQTSADQGASFVSTQIGILESCAAGVGGRVRISETGWPKQGSSNGAAVPSKANQDVVVAGIKGLSNAQDAIFLSSFDDSWKAPGPFNCEQFWGILDD